MLPYLSLMGIDLFFGRLLRVNKSKRNSNLFLFIIGFGLIFISGFRTIDIGVDTLQFCTNYVKIAGCGSVNEALAVTRYESGFVLFCYLLTRVSSNYQLLLFFSSFIITISILDFIKNNSQDIALSVYFYITMSFFGMYMNIMRQALAIAIFLWIYDKYYKDGKFIKYSIGVLIASSFHSTALVLLMLPLISKINFKPKMILLMSVGSILLFAFERQIITKIAFFTGYYGYLTKANYFEANYFGALILFLVNLLLFSFCFIQRNQLNNREENLLKVSFVSLLLTLCTVQISIVGRIAEFFNIFNILLIPNVLCVSNNIKNKGIFKLGIIVFLFIFWIVIAIYRPEWYGVVPYKSILF